MQHRVCRVLGIMYTDVLLAAEPFIRISTPPDSADMIITYVSRLRPFLASDILVATLLFWSRCASIMGILPLSMYWNLPIYDSPFSLPHCLSPFC